MSRFQSIKIIDGFSCCFRQEKSFPIHCSKLHGYSIKFEVTFEGELDYRNWVVDFGFLKRSKNKIVVSDGTGFYTELSVDEWFKYFFDHSVIIASDDSQLEWFIEAEKKGILQLRILDSVGCERFAEFVYKNLNTFINKETDGKVKVVRVKCSEYEKNSAVYEE